MGHNMAQTPSILIIDDSATSCHLMESALTKEGCIVRTAGNGREGLAMLLRECPHCVVLDVVLPGISGYEICRLLRSKPILQRLPVIMVSTKNTLLDKTWALRQGATNYLIKPFQNAEFINTIKTAIANYTPPTISAMQAALQQHPVAAPEPVADPRRAAPQMVHENVTQPYIPSAHASSSLTTGAIPSGDRESLAQNGPYSPAQLIPVRDQGQNHMRERNSQTLLTGNLHVRRLYEAIDDQRNLETLCMVTRMSREEVIRALRSLLAQHLVHLCEPSGKIVANN